MTPPLGLRADELVEQCNALERAIDTVFQRLKVYSIPSRSHASQKSRRMSLDTWSKK